MKWEDEKEKLNILINIEHLAYEKIMDGDKSIYK
jgi:hypothetical protein